MLCLNAINHAFPGDNIQVNQESASLYHAEYRKIQPHNKVKGIFKVSLKKCD